MSSQTKWVWTGLCHVVNLTGPNAGRKCNRTCGNFANGKCDFHTNECIDTTIDCDSDSDEDDADDDSFINDEAENSDYGSDDESEDDESDDDESEDDESEDDESVLSGNEARERAALEKRIRDDMVNYLAKLSLADMKQFKKHLPW